MYKINNSLAEEKNERSKSFYQIISFLLCIMIVFSLFQVLGVNRFTVEVKGKSMQPTLFTNDILIVDEKAQIERGDIVVIQKDYLLVKRIIGLPGEVVSIKDGYVYINGTLLDEPYVIEQGVTQNYESGLVNEDYIVGEGEYFFLGDNRINRNSEDSRSNKFKMATLDEIEGVVPNWSLKLKGVSTFFVKLFSKI